MVLMHETFGNHCLQHCEKVVPIAVDIQDDDRFLVKIQLSPGGDLHGFVKRSKATGKHHEAIALGIHHFLSLMHCVDHMKLCDAGMSNFNFVKKFRYDSSHMAAGINGTVGNAPHQSAASPAIDNAHAMTRDKPAKFIGGIGKHRVASGGGAGKNADIFHD